MACSPGMAATATPVLLGVEYHPGETVRYTFSLRMNLTTRVEPSVSSDVLLRFTPRKYTVEGGIVATFAPAQPGEPLHGTVQFQGLTVKDWASTANVADLEARLRLLESAPITVSTAADGNLALSEMPSHPLQDRYVLDVEDLNSIAQALLISRISSQPLAPGQQIESADFPIPGMVKPGIKLTVVTDYVTDIPLARHPSAELRLTMNVPNQSHSVPSDSDTSRTSERFFAAGVWTYLLDLDAHQISFLHKTIRTETGYSAESGDSNVEIRIPKNLFTVDKEYEVMARRVAASASPEFDADLTTFEKSLPSALGTASTGSAATPAASPGGGASLGDIARRLRAERTAQGTPQIEATEPKEVTEPKEATVPGNVLAPESIPAGFKLETFPGGTMTVHVPVEVSEINRTSNRINLQGSLGNPRPIIFVVLQETDLNPGESSDHALNDVVAGVQASPGMQVLHSERREIHGLPGLVIEELYSQGGTTTHGFQSCVVSAGRAFMTSCGAQPENFPKVESPCWKVVNSIRGR